MTAKRTTGAAGTTTEMSSEPPLIAGCGLDIEGSRGQRERYRALAGEVRKVRHGPETLTISFTRGVDRALLETTIAVERECCPFFTFDYLPAERILAIGVIEDECRPALDALAYALGDDAGREARRTRS